MGEGAPTERPRTDAPLHLWIVGLLLVLWNGWGAARAIALQTGRMPDIYVEDAAFFEAQPLWFVLFADIGPFAGVAGSVALLLQHRSAVWLFGVQLGVIILANLYELIIGRSFWLRNPDELLGFVVLLALFAGQLAYARWLRKRGVLT